MKRSSKNPYKEPVNKLLSREEFMDVQARLLDKEDDIPSFSFNGITYIDATYNSMFFGDMEYD